MTITAKVLAYSRDYRGRYIVSWELEYPRFIHGEFLTHRLFSRNSASSRAIPVAAVIKAVRDNPAKPIHWGKNQPGMQASIELVGRTREIVEDQWETAAINAAKSAETMGAYGAHKQIVNRLLEPFQTMKTVMTATCMENFFWLRNHADAQPEIKELARVMLKALDNATAMELKPGEWHVPYVHTCRSFTTQELEYWDLRAAKQLTLEEALAVSSSCCAQVSYRKLDDTLEKAQMVYQRLVGSEPVHASPFEHQSTPVADSKVEVCNDYGDGQRYYFGKNVNQIDPSTWQEGITHMDRDGNFWSGNFVGWIQHRQLIPNNVYKE